MSDVMNTLTCELDAHQKHIEAFDLFNLEIICMYVDFFSYQICQWILLLSIFFTHVNKVKSDLLWS